MEYKAFISLNNSFTKSHIDELNYILFNCMFYEENRSKRILMSYAISNITVVSQTVVNILWFSTLWLYVIKIYNSMFPIKNEVWCICSSLTETFKEFCYIYGRKKIVCSILYCLSMLHYFKLIKISIHLWGAWAP